MIANDTRDERLAELRRHSFNASSKHVCKIVNRLLSSPVIRLRQFFVNVAPDHVATETQHDAGILRLRAAHVVVGEIDGRVHQPLHANLRDLHIVFVDAADFILGDLFTIMEVAPNRHGGAACTGLAVLVEPCRRFRGAFSQPVDRLADTLSGFFFVHQGFDTLVLDLEFLFQPGSIIDHFALGCKTTGFRLSNSFRKCTAANANCCRCICLVIFVFGKKL